MMIKTKIIFEGQRKKITSLVTIQMENNEVKNPNWKEMDQLHGSNKIWGEKIKDEKH